MKQNPRPLKIAVLAFSFLPHLGGAEVFTYNLLQRLSARSHTVHLLLPFYWYRRYRSMGVQSTCRVMPAFVKERRLLDLCPTMLAYIPLLFQAAMHYDVWQIIGSYPAAFAAGKVASRVPAVVRSYGLDIQKEASLDYGMRLDAVVEQRIKRALAKMTALVALTPSIASEYRNLGVPESKIVEIPNGIELERFQDGLDRRKIRQQLGVREGETLVLTVGRYHRKKGYEFIPPAAKYLLERGHKIRWVIVGKGTQQIARQVQETGVGSAVVLREHVGMEGRGARGLPLRVPATELVNLYRSADIFVLPSLIEGLSNVLLEAMAAHLPIVTTDVPGNRDVIAHRSNGLLAAPSDWLSLAHNIEALLTDSQLRNALVARAGEDIKKYSWDTIAARYEELYYKLTQDRP